MSEKLSQKTKELMEERFQKDSILALATMDGTTPWVRNVDGYYEDGAFYTITYALSNKIKQIELNPTVAICGEWFTAHGVGENLGHILRKENEELAAKLRKAFALWYDNGHTNEADPNTCILCIHLTDGILFSQGTRYHIDFTK